MDAVPIREHCNLFDRGGCSHLLNFCLIVFRFSHLLRETKKKYKEGCQGMIAAAPHACRIRLALVCRGTYIQRNTIKQGGSKNGNREQKQIVNKSVKDCKSQRTLTNLGLRNLEGNVEIPSSSPRFQCLPHSASLRFQSSCGRTFISCHLYFEESLLVTSTAEK